MFKYFNVHAHGRDFMSLQTLEVFVLPLHGLHVIQRFLIGVLEFEELSAKRSGLFLGALQLSLSLLILLLPLR